MKVQLNKWHFKLMLLPDYYKGGGVKFVFGIFKLTSYPPEGCMVARDNYKGFWITKDIYELIIIDL